MKFHVCANANNNQIYLSKNKTISTMQRLQKKIAINGSVTYHKELVLKPHQDGLEDSELHYHISHYLLKLVRWLGFLVQPLLHGNDHLQSNQLSLLCLFVPQIPSYHQEGYCHHQKRQKGQTPTSFPDNSPSDELVRTVVDHQSAFSIPSRFHLLPASHLALVQSTLIVAL